MKKLLSAVTSVAMSFTLMAGAFASSVSAAGGLSAVQPNVSLGEVLDVSANRTAADGTVEWLIPTVTAAPGQTVTMPVVVKSSSLAVAGAQFKIQAATGVSYSSKTDGDAYGSGIVYNNSKYAFGQGAGRGIVAADDSVVLTLAYTVPADCAEGTYDVKWSDAFVSDTDGQNITSKVTLTDGAIIVKKDNNTGKIKWVLDKVTAAPGETVTVKATVDASGEGTVAVAGAQFDVNADSPIVYDSAKEGGAYITSLTVNDAKHKFAFGRTTGTGIVAADKATVAAFTYKVPSDCTEGTYDVKWSGGFVSDADGKDITSRVTFVDGSITVKNDVTDGKVKWVLDNVTAAQGETVTLKAVVDDSAKAAVPVAGAQFKLQAADAVKYSSFTDGTAYGAAFTKNDDKQSFAFGNTGGKGVAAADKAAIYTVSYTVPTDCPDGTYPVKWADTFVSDTDGRNITSNIIFVDGSITVGKPVTGTVEWVIPKVDADAGDNVTLQVAVKGDADLPVSAAQFDVNGATPLNYQESAGKPYGVDLVVNDTKQHFAFAQASGISKTAKDGDKLFTITFKVPEDCADGIYPVTWAKQFVSDENGNNITDKVTFTDGWVRVGNPPTTTTTTTSVTTTTTTTTVTAPQGGIIWAIDTVTVEPGQTATLNIKVVDEDNSKLPIAGAQFNIVNKDGVNYSSIAGSEAYGPTITANDAKKKFDFANASGVETVGANNANVAVLTYTVPATAEEGVYPVQFAEGSLKIFDKDGKDISDKIIGVDGAIIVKKPVVTDVTSTTTVTSNVNTTTSTTTVTAPQGGIIWAIDTVTVEPGQTATLNIKVVDLDDSQLPIAGAQFNIVNKDGVNYSSIAGSEAYGPKITANDAKKKFDFANASGVETVGANDAIVAVLTYTVPATAEEGVYPVQFAEGSLKIFDKDGKDISDKIIGVDGAIIVKKPVITETSTTTTVTGKPNTSTTTTTGTDVTTSGNETTDTTETTVTTTDVTGPTTTSTDTTVTSSVVGPTTTSTIVTDTTVTSSVIGPTTTTTVVTDTTVTSSVIGPTTTTTVVTDTTVTSSVIGPTTTTTVVTDTTVTSSVIGPTTTTTVVTDTTVTSSVIGPTTTSTTVTTEVTGPTDTTATSTGTSTTDVTGPTDTTVTSTGTSTTDVTGPTDTTVTSTGTSTTDVTGPTDTTVTSTGTSTTDVTGPTDTTVTDTTVTTVVTNPTTTLTTTTIVVPKDSIAWVVDTVAAYPGDEVTLKITVKDPNAANLGIAGAQFKVTPDGDVQLVKSGDKSGYGADIIPSKDGYKFVFADGAGVAHVAPDGTVVIELTYKVGEEVAPGTVIPVSIKDLYVVDEDGNDITKYVMPVDGSIIVFEKPASTSTTTNVTVTTVTTDVTGPTDTTVTSTGTSTTDVTGPTDTTVTSTGTSTTDVTGPTDTTVTSTSTTTDVTGPTDTTVTSTSTTTDVTGPTDTTVTSTSTTTDVTGPTDTTETSTSTTTDVTGPTTTSTTSTSSETTSTETTSTDTSTSTSSTSTTSTTDANYDHSYAVIETQVGYYFSHDDGVRANGQVGGFNKGQVVTLKIVDVYKDGSEVERPEVNMDLINFNNNTPEKAYNSRTHINKQTTITDFKYDIPVYYGDMPLVDKSGKALTVTAYIGVKGDITLSNMVDSNDASVALSYYTLISTGSNTPANTICQITEEGLQVSSALDELDNLAAFLGDVNTNEWDPDNWKTTKMGRKIDSNDASQILAFYSKRTSHVYDDVSSNDIWNEILGDARFGK